MLIWCIGSNVERERGKACTPSTGSRKGSFGSSPRRRSSPRFSSPCSPPPPTRAAHRAAAASPHPNHAKSTPAPARADGSAVEVPKAGDLSPVEITVHVLAPAFVEPAPIGASFEAIAVPVRYQSPDDVSCGVQALGMALDGLPGVAPTSGAMLGLLQDNGMMYDYGTGVEELAYAAQSFGDKGSFAFHDASLDQLQAQLATGSPVVVSLGSNGESTPGHFVTVTGISADGQSHGDASRWVAYNDPTLGEQVLSASEFNRLWGLQGNSGVAVAKEPPAAAGDPDAFALWVAFAAGLMALVSTTPLGALRSGVGGRLDAGSIGGGRGAGSSKPARRSDPPAKEKEKEPKKPKATAPRFDYEPSPPPTPASTVVVTPSEMRAGQAKPGPAIKEDKPRPIVYTPSWQTQGTPKVTQTRGDPDPRPTPAPVATPSELRAAATPRPPSFDQRNDSRQVVYTPSPATQGTTILSQTAAPAAHNASDRQVGLPHLPEKYLKYLPTSTLAEWDYRTPSVPLGILEGCTQDAFHAGVPANPGLRLTPTKAAFNLGRTSVKVGWGGSSVEVALQTPRREFSMEGLGATVAVGQSGSISMTWDGWNTITKAAYNSVDYTVSGPADREVVYGSGKHGVYLEQKPVQVAVLSEIAVAFIALASLAPPLGAKALEFFGNGLNPLPVNP